MKTLKCTAIAAPILGATLFGAANAEPTFTRQITFGDSLSDGGYFASIAPPGAGRFTTNPDPVWVEIVASELGLTLTSSAAGGTNFAIGGARVSVDDPVRRSIVDQIGLFAASGGTFSETDLVTIQGGGNDVFAVGNGLATVDDLILAAGNLAGAVKQIKDLGAGTVIVTNVPTFDFYNLPFELTLQQLNPNALFIDVDEIVKEIVADPGSFGFVNVTDPACGGLNSLVCTPANYVTPDANLTYLFADDVHPAGRAQQIQADMTLAALRAPSMIDQLAFIGEGHLSGAQYKVLSNLLTSQSEGTSFLFADASGGKTEIDGGSLRTGLNEDSYALTLGADTQVSEKIGIGASLTYRMGDGSFEGGAGSFDSDSVIGTMFGRYQSDKLRLGGSISWGKVSFDDVSRNFILGISARTENGNTEANVFGAQVELGYTLYDQDWKIGPVIGLTHSNTDVDGYLEASGLSTSLKFADFDYSATRGFVGLEVVRNASEGLSPFLRVAYHSDLDEDDDRQFTITPDEAPISYTSDVYTPSTDFVQATGGLSMSVSDNTTFGFVLNGEFSRDDISRYDGSLRIAMTF